MNNALYFKVIYIVWYVYYNVFRMLMYNQLKNYCYNKHIKLQYQIEASSKENDIKGITNSIFRYRTKPLRLTKTSFCLMSDGKYF